MYFALCRSEFKSLHILIFFLFHVKNKWIDEKKGDKTTTTDSKTNFQRNDKIFKSNKKRYSTIKKLYTILRWKKQQIVKF